MRALFQLIIRETWHQDTNVVPTEDMKTFAQHNLYFVARILHNVSEVNNFYRFKVASIEYWKTNGKANVIERRTLILILLAVLSRTRGHCCKCVRFHRGQTCQAVFLFLFHEISFTMKWKNEKGYKS